VEGSEVLRFSVLRKEPIYKKERTKLPRLVSDVGQFLSYFEKPSVVSKLSTETQAEFENRRDALESSLKGHLEATNRLHDMPSFKILLDLYKKIVKGDLNIQGQKKTQDLLARYAAEVSERLPEDWNLDQFIGKVQDRLLAQLSLSSIWEDDVRQLEHVIKISSVLYDIAGGDSGFEGMSDVRNTLFQPLVLPNYLYPIEREGSPSNVESDMHNANVDAVEKYLLLKGALKEIKDIGWKATETIFSSEMLDAIEEKMLEPVVARDFEEGVIDEALEEEEGEDVPTSEKDSSLPKEASEDKEETTSNDMTRAVDTNFRLQDAPDKIRSLLKSPSLSSPTLESASLGTIDISQFSQDTQSVVSSLGIAEKPSYSKLIGAVENRLNASSVEFQRALRGLPKASDLRFQTATDRLRKIFAKAKMKPAGIADLQVAKRKIIRYELGEISHIENVMATETRSRDHRRLDRTEESTLLESISEEEELRDLQTTERFELERQAQQIAKQSSSFQVGGKASVNYHGGIVSASASANVGYSTSSSDQSSSATSSKYAREVVEKARDKVSESIKEQRNRKTLEEFEEKNHHSFKNETDEHVVGIYRWVDKIYEMQIENYGRRAMFEFVIPEPAIFLKWMQKNKPKNPLLPEEPEQPMISVTERRTYRTAAGNVFVPTASLEPLLEVGATAINEDNYLVVASQYGATVEPPPEKNITLSMVKDSLTQQIQGAGSTDMNAVKKADGDSDGDPPSSEMPDRDNEKKVFTHNFKVPKGYCPKGITINLLTSAQPRYDAIATVGSVIREVFPRQAMYGWSNQEDDGPKIKPFGESEPMSTPNNYKHRWYTNWNTISLDLDKVERWSSEIKGVEQWTEIPVGVILWGARAEAVVVACMFLVCERSKILYEQWQHKTYQAIFEAYEQQLDSYREAVIASTIGFGLDIEGRPPARNRSVERLELKKIALMVIMQGDANYRDDGGYAEKALLGSSDGEKEATSDSDHEDRLQINTETFKAFSGRVQFFEDAFEWEQMQFELLPYFWADSSRWPELIHAADVDPLHEAFLQAGAARVLIPVTPGLEREVATYLSTHKIWSSSDGEPPSFASEAYQGLGSVTQPEKPEPVGEPWEVRIPTTLVALEPKSGLDLPDWGKHTSSNLKQNKIGSSSSDS